MTPLQFAWFCCAFCVALSARTATTFFNTRPRLFTVMAFFALGWALLLPYYGPVGPRTELFAAYGGFILVYIGGLLTLEAVQSQAGVPTSVVTIQKLGLWLFLIIASPTVLKLDSPDGGLSLTRPQHEILVATLLDIAGYVSVAYGFWRISRDSMSTVLNVFLSLYALAEIIYTVVSWPTATGSPTMPEYLLVAFGIAKLLFTTLFCYGVSYHCLPETERPRNICHWAYRLLPFT